MPGVHMGRIAFLVDNDFEQVEYTAVRDGLQHNGHETVLLSVSETSVQGWNHNQRAQTFTVDGVLGEYPLHSFDALVLPGGVMNSDQLRVSASAQQQVRDFVQAGKVVAAICHAPWLLISAGVVSGRKMTAYHALRDDLVNADALYLDQACVRDGALITSRKPEDIDDFVQAIDEQLASVRR